jgi:hypothetical protein
VDDETGLVDTVADVDPGAVSPELTAGPDPRQQARRDGDAVTLRHPPGAFGYRRAPSR